MLCAQSIAQVSIWVSGFAQILHRLQSFKVKSMLRIMQTLKIRNKKRMKNLASQEDKAVKISDFRRAQRLLDRKKKWNSYWWFLQDRNTILSLRCPDTVPKGALMGNTHPYLLCSVYLLALLSVSFRAPEVHCRCQENITDDLPDVITAVTDCRLLATASWVLPFWIRSGMYCKCAQSHSLTCPSP